MKGTISWSLMIVFVGFLAVWIFEMDVACAQGVSPSQCQDEVQQVINACMSVVLGQQPSPACCARVRVTHTECVCPQITPQIASMIDAKRAKMLVEGCGRELPPNFKCGSLTIP